MLKMLIDLKPKASREWQGVSGLSEKVFEQLSVWSTEDYELIHGQSYKSMLSKLPSSVNVKIKSCKDLVFYTLIMLKSGITFDFAAFLMNFDQSRAYRQFVLGLDLLHNTLDIRGYLPFRSFDTPQEFAVQFLKSEVLIFDATEQKIQRPQDKEFQRLTYSGKRKPILLRQWLLVH